MLRWCAAALYVASVVRASHGQDVITTVAGNGGTTFSGDGGLATAASLKYCNSVRALLNASTGGVTLYIADSENNRIRRVDEAGIITTVAGNGAIIFPGDGGAATAASLDFPQSVSPLVNPSTGGVVLYIADTDHQRIRRVNEAGIMATVAGTGTLGFSGDGGLATAAQLYNPFGTSVVYNPNTGGVTLYIADRSNQRIRCVNEAGIISTVAGSDSATGFSGDGGAATAARLSNPQGVATLFNSNTGGVTLYIADTGNNRIRRVTEAGTITSVAGSSSTSGFGGDGGLATAALLTAPTDVALVSNATSGGVTLYITDRGNSRIRRVNET
ncbi:MAG: hypothetical protein EOO65_05590, partial [Methanosarcinales archaeon]